MAISKIFSIRNYVMKQIMKPNKQGIMQIPAKGKVDFGEMIIKEELFKKGIDPKAITSSKQLDNILNTPTITPHSTSKKSGEVFDLTGKKIDTSKPILGGKNVPESIDWDEVDKIDPEDFAHGGIAGKMSTDLLMRSERTESDIGGGMFSSTPDTAVKFNLDGETIFLKPDFFKSFMGPYMDDPEAFKRRVDDLKQEIRRNQSSVALAGGGLAPLLGEPTYADGGRIGFKIGGINKARRLFLQAMGAGAAGIGAAKSGLLGIFKGGAKKQIVEELTQVPIKNIKGMPSWFKPLVNRVIKEGDDVTKKFATKEREIVHTKKIGDPKDRFADEVTVTQDLDTGNVRVEYNASGNMGEAPIQLDYKAGEVIEKGSKKGTKTKSEFSAVEAEPRVTNWDGDIEFDGENVVSKVDDLLTDTTKLESYATGQKPTIKKLLKSEQKKKHVNKLNDDQMEQLEYIENKHGDVMEYIDEGARVGEFDSKGYRNLDTKGMNLPDKTKKASGGRVPLAGGKSPDPSNATTTQLLDILFDEGFDMEGILRLLKQSQVGNQGDFSSGYQSTWRKAEGGRVPFSKGKKVVEGLAWLANKIAPGSTKIGQTSKPMAEKTQLRRAITDFQERQKNKKFIDEDIKLIAKEQDLDEKMVRDIWKKHIADEGGIGSLDEFHADFVKETGINVSKKNLRHSWRMKRAYPFNTPIIDKTGKHIGGEATQVMYPKSKKFIISDEDKLTKEINLKREGKLPSGERAGIDVPPVPESFKLSREKLIENFPEIGLDDIDEIMKLDKETQARMIMMLKNRRLDPDLYDELLLKHGDTLDFQGEFDKAIRRKKNASGGRVSLSGGGLITLAKLMKLFPKIHKDSLLKASRITDSKKLQKMLKSFRKTEEAIDKSPSVELFDLDVKGRKPNASGGLAGMLGE